MIDHRPRPATSEEIVSINSDNDRDIQHYKQTIAAFQEDKERYLKVQMAVDLKQRKLKEQVKELQRQNDLMRRAMQTCSGSCGHALREHIRIVDERKA